MLARDGEILTILDAKWKSLSDGPQGDDVHQILAYANAFGCGDVRLIYPGKRFRTHEYHLEKSAIRLTVHTLRVVGSHDECEKSWQKFKTELTTKDTKVTKRI